MKSRVQYEKDHAKTNKYNFKISTHFYHKSSKIFDN